MEQKDKKMEERKMNNNTSESAKSHEEEIVKEFNERESNIKQDIKKFKENLRQEFEEDFEFYKNEYKTKTNEAAKEEVHRYKAKLEEAKEPSTNEKKIRGFKIERNMPPEALLEKSLDKRIDAVLEYNEDVNPKLSSSKDKEKIYEDKKYWNYEEGLKGLLNGDLNERGKKKILNRPENIANITYSHFHYRDVHDIPSEDITGKTFYFKYQLTEKKIDEKVKKLTDIISKNSIINLEETVVLEIHVDAPKKKKWYNFWYNRDRKYDRKYIVLATNGLDTGIVKAVLPVERKYGIKLLEGGEDKLYIFGQGKHILPWRNKDSVTIYPVENTQVKLPSPDKKKGKKEDIINHTVG